MSANPKSVQPSHEFQLLINGRKVPGAQQLEVINPATGKVFAHCARANLAQLEEAVAAAKAAFPAWSRLPITERRALLQKVAAALQERSEEFARLLTQETGKPLASAQREVKGAIGLTRVYAALDLPSKVLKQNEHGRVVRQQAPLGVVAAITAWNFPLTLLANKVPPALLAGNTVVIKPAPTTPLATMLFAELCADILPPGVLNLIVDQNDLGSALTEHLSPARPPPARKSWRALRARSSV
jgi:acyl-CoA reductase-like NAD-dependent aldehyde dehydrogenase